MYEDVGDAEAHRLTGGGIRQASGLEDGRPAPLPLGPKLNLGCGPVQPSGWINIDGSNRAMLAGRFSAMDRLLVRLGLLPPTEFGPHVKVHDLQKPLPFSDGSVACIYAGELWEHFRYEDSARLTSECHRVLAANGVLRVCVPDGAEFWRNYLQIFEGQLRAPRELRSAAPLRTHVGMYFNDIATTRNVLRSIGHTHKWQFDEVQLMELFEKSGFTQVERQMFRVSRIPDIAEVEGSDFLIVEGVKA